MTIWSSLLHGTAQEDSREIYFAFYEFATNLHEFWMIF
jgi:hypothetical protein